MAKGNYSESVFGANWPIYRDLENQIPLQQSSSTEVSDNSFIVVIAYTVVFVIASIGHLFSFTSLWKQFKIKKSRIYLLLLHLSLADWIVCLVIVPTEIVWRLSVQWEGGNILCKTVQFFRAFGLYLSSLILICLAIDRFISILFQADVIGTMGYSRTKLMIASAWIAAAVFSAPQAILFRVESHPYNPDFQQCITSEPHDPENFTWVKLYSIFSLVVMYFVPLLTIVVTYTLIFFKLTIMSNELNRSRLKTDMELQSVSVNMSDSKGGILSAHHSTSSTSPQEPSINVQANLTQAKMRALWMTVVIIFAFVICWTPYAVMTLWYIADWENAKKVDPRIQDALFLMVVSNSCVNPLIYGGFSQRFKIRSRNRSFC